MDIMIPSPATEFNFNSTNSTPYASAPSSPKRFGEFYSAPTSPIRASSIYNDFNRFSGSASVIPFDWDENPPIPPNSNDSDDDFAFNLVLNSENSSLTADELFDGGKIRPLLPPIRLSHESGHKMRSPISSPRSPKSPIAQGKKMFWNAILPSSVATNQTQSKIEEQNRGRGRTPVSLSTNSKRRESRSLSPLRVAEFAWEEQKQQQNSKPISDSSSSSSSSSRRWRFRDLLLFRSASEGRASDKDPLRKYTALPKRNEDDKKFYSFRSTESNTAGSSSRKKESGSAHELHYKVNRAVGEDSRKKTYLPYKPTLLGCIGFNPTAYGLSQRI